MFKYEYYSSNIEDNYSIFYSSIRNNIKETAIIICEDDNYDNDDNDNDDNNFLCIPNLFTDINIGPSFSCFIDEEQPFESSKLLTKYKKIKLEFLYSKKENKPYLLSSFSISTNYNYKEIENITKQIINQIDFLEKNNLTFLKIDLNDILIIENNEGSMNEIKCAIINSSNLIHIKAKPETGKLIHIDYPFDKIIFMSPELKNIFEIPAYISHTTIYYNIGSLILFIYLQNLKEVDNEITKNDNEITKNDNEITKYDNEMTKYDNDNLNYYLNNKLINIYNTKLFWFIKKSIIKNENGERFLKY